MSQQPQGGAKRKADGVVVEKAPVINPEALAQAYSYEQQPQYYAPTQYLPQLGGLHGASSSVPPMPYYPTPPSSVTPSVMVQIAPQLAKKNASAGTKVMYRKAAGKAWEDTTLADWPENDFRIFVGDLGNEVNEDILKNAFSKYPSYQKCKVIRDPKSLKSKGYGFVSFSDPRDYVKALREMNGKYIGNRPVKLRKSDWKQYTDEERAKAIQQKQQKQQSGKGKGLTKKRKVG